jgi:hypothetical protein
MAFKEVVRNEFVQQLTKFVQKMETSKGDFTLAMLVPSPSGLFDKWNLVVSAKWIDDQELLRAIPTISSALLKNLSEENVRKIERISPLSTNDSIVRDLVGSVEVTPTAGRGVRVQSFALTSRGIEGAILLAARNPTFVQSRRPQTVRARG